MSFLAIPQDGLHRPPSTPIVEAASLTNVTYKEGAMNHAAQLLHAKRMLASSLLAVFFASLTPLHQAPAQDQSVTATTSVTGTVRAVDTKSRTIEIVTGVGYATRALRLQIAEDGTIVVPRAAAAQLSSLVPGMVARIEYVATPSARTHGVAVKIEALDVEGGKGRP